MSGLDGADSHWGHQGLSRKMTLPVKVQFTSSCNVAVWTPLEPLRQCSVNLLNGTRYLNILYICFFLFLGVTTGLEFPIPGRMPNMLEMQLLLFRDERDNKGVDSGLDLSTGSAIMVLIPNSNSAKLSVVGSGICVKKSKD